MSRKLEDTDFQFAVPSGVPKRRKVEVKNSDLNNKLTPLSRSSSFSFKTPRNNENLDSAFQSVATESSSKKSKSNSMPRMSSFLLKDTRPHRNRKSHSLKKISAFTESWAKLGSSDSKNKSRNYSKNLDDKFTSNLLFDKDYREFIAPLVGDAAGDKVDLDVAPPVGDSFDQDDGIKSSKDSVDLDITPPVGDLFDDEDDEDDGKDKDSIDLDITPPVGDLFDDEDDDDCKKEEEEEEEEVDLDKTPPVGDLFTDYNNNDDDDDDADNPADSEDLQDITPPVSPSLNFEEDDVPVFDTWKITTSDGVILQTGDDDQDNPRASVGASRVFHVLPGDDQVQLTLTI